MTTDPDDADSAVLADLASRGVDLSQPLLIEFAVAVPDEASANKTLKALTLSGYDSHIEYDEGESDGNGVVDPDDEEFGPSWTVFVLVRMIPEYNEIMRIQAELDELSRPFGGNSDGWGVMLDGDAEA